MSVAGSGTGLEFREIWNDWKSPLLREAVAAHRAGRLDAAHPLYCRFLTENPGHPMALQLLGLLHSQRGEYDAAIALMRESLRRFPEQPEVANNLGTALSERGKLDEAIESYSLAVKLDPHYADALRNLGLCYIEKGNLEQAKVSFERCIKLRPDDAAAWLALGNAYQKEGDLRAAIRCYEQALALRPDYAEAHHNLGVCLRLTRRPGDAVRHYEAARRQGLDRAELYYNLGNARVDSLDIPGAIDAYRAAVSRNPEDVASHRNLNLLLWEQEMFDEYLESYRTALAACPDSAPLRCAYATALSYQERHAEAEAVLRDGLQRLPDSAAFRSLLAYSLEAQRRWSEALQMHAGAVAMPGAAPVHHIDFARALLSCRRPDEALPHVERAVRAIPRDQRAIAYLGLCWRMLGHEDESRLNDYDSFVRVYDVPVPRRFANSREFNARLSEVLEQLHVSKCHPPEQTLRGGTQTHGDVLYRQEPEIQELVIGLSACIKDYIIRLPHDAAHPLASRRSEHFDFAASWSARLRPRGYHTTHIHPLGWISSAYYVQVPPEIVESDAHGGGIKFGEPDIDLGPQGTARKVIQPRVGRLVLFPSYMWHGTVPFESDQPRMTVAFDVVPKA